MPVRLLLADSLALHSDASDHLGIPGDADRSFADVEQEYRTPTAVDDLRFSDGPVALAPGPLPVDSSERIRLAGPRKNLGAGAVK